MGTGGSAAVGTIAGVGGATLYYDVPPYGAGSWGITYGGNLKISFLINILRSGDGFSWTGNTIGTGTLN